MTDMPKPTHVSRTYRHYEKTVYGHGVIQSTHNRLKWYDIARGRKPIDPEIRDLAQDFLARQTASVGLPAVQELGFVLLHKCGQNFYFLGLCTWRENNELWKTQFYFDAGKMEDFALYPPKGSHHNHPPQDHPPQDYPPQDYWHKDTFCIWELNVVSYETQAWTKYLRSERTDQNADAYLAANYSA